MAELHVVGEIVGAMGFQEKNLFCKVRASYTMRSIRRDTQDALRLEFSGSPRFPRTFQISR